MSVNVPYFPGTKWAGITPSRSSRIDDLAPSFEDFDQLVAEMISLQDQYLVSLVNTTGGASIIGSPVYLNSSGEAVHADANGSGTRHLFGLVAEDGIAAAASMLVRIGGFMTLTAAQWDTICGTTGGLTPGTPYYLSTTVGKLTSTAPSTTGDTVNRAILAFTATKALVLCRFEKTA